jgi:hypothetical protein
VPTFQSSYTISATTFYELWKAMGTSKSYDSSAAFRFEVPELISPLTVQGLQIGGTRPGRAAPFLLSAEIWSDYLGKREPHMKKLAMSIAFLLLLAITADAAGSLRKHGRSHAPKAHASEPAPAPTPPVTRLPVAPDTFRAEHMIRRLSPVTNG